MLFRVDTHGATGVRITVVRLSVLIEPAAGNAYDEDTKLRALERYGTRFRIGMTTLVVFGVLAAGFVGSPAAAAVEDGAPTELWEQFPLDGARDAATPREQSSDAVRAVSEPARVSSPASVQAAQSDEADETLRVAALATEFGLLIVGVSAAFARARRARRRFFRRSKEALRVAARERLTILRRRRATKLSNLCGS